MKSVIFFKDAETEFLGAIKYYNHERPGWGYEFAIQVDVSIRHIAKFPETWPILSGETIRCAVSRYTYFLLYLIDDVRIVIIAVMHAKRKPQYREKQIR